MLNHVLTVFPTANDHVYIFHDDGTCKNTLANYYCKWTQVNRYVHIRTPDIYTDLVTKTASGTHRGECTVINIAALGKYAKHTSVLHNASPDEHVAALIEARLIAAEIMRVVAPVTATPTDKTISWSFSVNIDQKIVDVTHHLIRVYHTDGLSGQDLANYFCKWVDVKYLVSGVSILDLSMQFLKGGAMCKCISVGNLMKYDLYKHGASGEGIAKVIKKELIDLGILRESSDMPVGVDNPDILVTGSSNIATGTSIFESSQAVPNNTSTKANIATTAEEPLTTAQNTNMVHVAHAGVESLFALKPEPQAVCLNTVAGKHGLYVLQVTCNDGRVFYNYGAANDLRDTVISFMCTVRGLGYHVNVIKAVECTAKITELILNDMYLSDMQSNSGGCDPFWGHITINNPAMV